MVRTSKALREGFSIGTMIKPGTFEKHPSDVVGSILRALLGWWFLPAQYKGANFLKATKM